MSCRTARRALRADSAARDRQIRQPVGTVFGFDMQLDEVINRTAHAGALSALIETARGYRFYFAVYVREVSPFTSLYMAAIDPFRKAIVYPALLRSVAAQWKATFGPEKRYVRMRLTSEAPRIPWTRTSSCSRAPQMFCYRYNTKLLSTSCGYEGIEGS